MSKIVFVCQRNAGKSQMAAAVMRTLSPEIEVVSAGVKPGVALNELSMQVLRQRGYETEGEHPKSLRAELLDHADMVVFLGNEAHYDVPSHIPVQRWNTVEPSLDGIEGIRRMNMILDDIEHRVQQLINALSEVGH
ncbi:low molecular weight phosphatase family protein [Corynebacterium sp. sy017]|uniref:arsenate-mycothiol transferase ArsC n=1 Tax=unclassified Corynebacterium TaxID=2624378 RepID=UPI0011848C80|nr:MULTISPECIES: low molecular weight phosphatase family protein [unclassified Corynebacterium]MBP3088952.1 low molecular weight phosphatase family protein [Corynebacterium sp. sy017]QDZ42326.1 low molecular weight phosphatase family protein [Corynebacterium sp. sy039]TSD91278.1 low molecular weight phosphatase family protein [Corynebacterium sp. SY003]